MSKVKESQGVYILEFNLKSLEPYLKN